jgi:hypothetical protein
MAIDLVATVSANEGVEWKSKGHATDRIGRLESEGKELAATVGGNSGK